MNDAVVIALVAVMALVLLDGLVLAGLVLLRRRRAKRRPVPQGTAAALAASPTAAAAAAIGTVLYAVPLRQDPAAAMTALGEVGYCAVIDPEDDRLLLIACPRGPEHRDQVRVVPTREARRYSRTPGWSGPVRFADEL